MTSNIGAELIRKGSQIGFSSHTDEAKTQQQNYDSMKEKLLGEVKKAFKPEFFNRLDGTIVFHPLNQEQILQIVDLVVGNVTSQLSERDISIEISQEAKTFLGKKGYDEVYGARPLKRVIQDLVEDPISEGLLRGSYKSGDTIKVDLKEDQIVITSSSKDNAVTQENITALSVDG